MGRKKLMCEFCGRVEAIWVMETNKGIVLASCADCHDAALFPDEYNERKRKERAMSEPAVHYCVELMDKDGESHSPRLWATWVIIDCPSQEYWSKTDEGMYAEIWGKSPCKAELKRIKRSNSIKPNIPRVVKFVEVTDE